MPRRKPNSHKQKKLQMKTKALLHKGEISQADYDQFQRSSQAKKRWTPAPAKSGDPSSMVITNRKLQSRFTALSSDFLTRTRDLAFSETLPRPLDGDSAIFPMGLLSGRDTEDKLTCPSRPRFRHGQTKKEVEKNEEGAFKRWLRGVEDIMEGWVDGVDEEVPEKHRVDDEPDHIVDAEVEEDVIWPRGPTWFETNLEVWRQLWRVTESSDILLLLLDSRCPPLHCPPSLRSYLQSLKPRKEIVLVLTKSDLVDPAAVEGWKAWAKEWWGEEGVQVVSVRSYDVDMLSDGKGRHKPDIPRQSLDELISALKTAHERLLQPSAWTREKPERLEVWKPTVRSKVDWADLVDKDDSVHAGSSRFVTHANVQVIETVTSTPGNDEEPHFRDPEREPLTVGLIGQPNVGKSSLLNALLGEQKVRASRTPGKTKHFQTMFWGGKKEVKIVDCPGLVCPSLVGLEIQALAGIIPISQIPSLPACIHFAALHLPLEIIFRVPRTEEDYAKDEYAGKRTYRDPALAEEKARQEKEKKERWTAGGILEGRALDRGYLTAKGGRPDINRAADAMMRVLADGKVRWGFNPPGMKGKEGMGIWLNAEGEDARLEDGVGATQRDREEEDSHLKEEEEEEEEEEIGSESDGWEIDLDDVVEESENDNKDDEETEEEEDDEEEKVVSKAGGFFAALEMDDDEDEDEDEKDDGEDVEGNDGEDNHDQHKSVA
ncbi:hypothetical protein IAR55_004426 [Kwoniella newhampshirensis]|uniref:Guanine nucleotide-binding protein-like 1 n=1 Tax=Kwoniella newhampshirensis TaxID=1651941 RepID=A0AAW0YKU5_9TREE